MAINCYCKTSLLLLITIIENQIDNHKTYSYANPPLPSQNLHIQTASDIFQLLQPAFLRQSKLNRDREHLWLMCLDHSQTPGSKSGAGSTLELLGLGTQQTVLIDAMEVFHRALLRRAASIVVAHNHPAGSLKPSRSDITATEKLVDASHFLNIKLLDHLIISEKEFYSFRDGGEFEKMNTRKFIMFNSVLAME